MPANCTAHEWIRIACCNRSESTRVRERENPLSKDDWGSNSRFELQRLTELVMQHKRLQLSPSANTASPRWWCEVTACRAVGI